MATPVPPPAPRHLRLLRLLLSGLVLGAALNGAAAGRPGERARWAQAAGCPKAGIAGQEVGLRGATAILPGAYQAGRPRRPGPLPLRPRLAWDGVNRPGLEGCPWAPLDEALLGLSGRTRSSCTSCLCLSP